MTSHLVEQTGGVFTQRRGTERIVTRAFRHNGSRPAVTESFADRGSFALDSVVFSLVQVSMTSLHQRAKDLFLAALERPAADRPAFLAEACAGDAALRQEVESLLAFHDEPEGAGQAPDDTATPFAPGEVFAGRYRMITRIGRGGMGDVWRADDLVLGPRSR